MIKKSEKIKAKEEVEYEGTSNEIEPDVISASYDGIIGRNFENLEKNIGNLEEVISILFKKISPVVHPDYKKSLSSNNVVGDNNESEVSNSIVRQYRKIEGLIFDVATITKFIEL